MTATASTGQLHADGVDPLDLISPQAVRACLARRTRHGRRCAVKLRSIGASPQGFESFWAITKHADIIEVSGQPDVFCNSQGIVVLNDQQIAANAQGDSPLRAMRTIIEMDPPDHRLYRKLRQRILYAHAASTELDQIVTIKRPRAWSTRLGDEGECDFIERIAQRHPLRVLATILGHRS